MNPLTPGLAPEVKNNERAEASLAGKAAAAHARGSREVSEWAGRKTAGGAKQIEKIRYSHDAMVDVLIANPGVTQAKLAEYFGYTAAWVSTITASDAFQVRLADRKHELVDPAIALGIEERFRALATRSLEVLQKKLSMPDDLISEDIALKCAALGAKALGIGGNAAPRTVILNQSDRLEGLAGKLTNLLDHKRKEAEYVEVVVEG